VEEVQEEEEGEEKGTDTGEAAHHPPVIMISA
jgi:hypothetical protein